MAILVSGGAGYIGSHTAAQLLAQGEEIVILDNFSNSKPEVLDAIRTLTGRDFPFYQADLLDEGQLEQVFQENAIHTVIHFAGLKAVGESVAKPLLYYHNNLTGTLNLCRAMERHGCFSLVFSSSATVYYLGCNTAPFREDFPLGSTNPYGMTKVYIEQILTDLAASDSRWRIALMRYFNPIGAHPSGLLGEDPNGIPNNLLPYIAKVALGELPCLKVYGDDYDTPDGTGIRDYIHVCDLAQGHICALDYLKDNPGAHPINLGSGKGYSVLEVADAFERASGVKIPRVIAPRRDGDIARSYADASLAKEILHWEARRGIDEMCRDAWNYTLLHRQQN